MKWTKDLKAANLAASRRPPGKWRRAHAAAELVALIIWAPRCVRHHYLQVSGGGPSRTAAGSLVPEMGTLRQNHPSLVSGDAEAVFIWQAPNVWQDGF